MQPVGCVSSDKVSASLPEQRFVVTEGFLSHGMPGLISITETHIPRALETELDIYTIGARV